MTPTIEQRARAMTETQRRPPNHAARSWTLSTAVGVIVVLLVAIGMATSSLSLWLGAVTIDAVVPGLVSSDESGTLVAAAFLAIGCGAAGVAAYLWGMLGLRSNADNRGVWNGLTIATVAIWVIAAFVVYAMVSSVSPSLTHLGWSILIISAGAAALTLGASLAARSLRRSAQL